jgi:hypothetical protein
MLTAPLHMADLPGTIGVILAAEASIHYAMSKQCHGGCAGLAIGVGFGRQIAPYSKERLAGVHVDHNLSPVAGCMVLGPPLRERMNEFSPLRMLATKM